MHPCDDVSFAACIPNHICKKMLGNSYECVTDFGMSERPNICDHNLCRDNFVCVGKENSYLCQGEDNMSNFQFDYYFVSTMRSISDFH